MYVFFVIIFAIISLVYSFMQLKKIMYIKYKQRVFDSTPKANFAMLGLYVKFKGRVNSIERYRLKMPQENRESAVFTIFEIFAQWKVKRKKPQSGFETVNKPFLHTITPTVITLLEENRKVKIRIVEPYKKESIIEIHERKKSLPKPLFPVTEDEKYENYVHKKGDIVTVYGRLSEENGELIIQIHR